MAYVPGYLTDIFISYAHRDDYAAAGPGWVTALHERLLIEAGQKLGADLEVWRDARLGGGTVFTPELERQVRGAAVILAIVSPSYDNSTWCRWELEKFVQWADERHALRVGNESRAIKILKSPLDNDGDRRILPGTSGFKFWYEEKQSKFTFEHEVDSTDYTRILSELAQRIATILKELATARTVYLAAAMPGFEEQRSLLKRELERQQFRVVSSTSDTATTVDEEAIHRAIEASGLSIHFASAKDDTTDAASRSLRETELRVAEALNRPRIVSAKADDASQASDQLDRFIGQGMRADNADVLVNKRTEVVKEIVLDKLNAVPPPNESTEDLIRVYLVCDHPDHPFLVDNHARRVQEYLNEQGFEVKLPLGDTVRSPTFTRDNKEKLKECDGVLLYWGETSQAWFDEKLRELRQAVGWRRARQFASKAAYLTDPENPVKRNYMTREMDEFVRRFVNFSPQALQPFVRKLRGKL